MGIEPTFAAWEAAVLPMNYIRVCPAGVAPGHRHAVLEFGGCRWVGRQPPCVREDRKMESKGGVYLALDFIIRYPSKGVFDI